MLCVLANLNYKTAVSSTIKMEFMLITPFQIRRLVVIVILACVECNNTKDSPLTKQNHVRSLSVKYYSFLSVNIFR